MIYLFYGNLPIQLTTNSEVSTHNLLHVVLALPRLVRGIARNRERSTEISQSSRGDPDTIMKGSSDYRAWIPGLRP